MKYLWSGKKDYYSKQNFIYSSKYMVHIFHKKKKQKNN